MHNEVWCCAETLLAIVEAITIEQITTLPCRVITVKSQSEEVKTGESQSEGRKKPKFYIAMG